MSVPSKLNVGQAESRMAKPASLSPEVSGGRALLEVQDLSIRFGGLAALSNVSFSVSEGQICGLIGPNGAGKTTIFNCISRIYQSDEGRVELSGRNLLDYSRHELVGHGLGRTFQNLALFESMTVLENVMLGAHSNTRTGYLANMLRLPSVRREETNLRDSAMDMLRYLSLEFEARRLVRDLPFGTRKRIEIARALISNPSIILLDEPAGGLNQGEVGALADLIIDIRQRMSTSILLVEHHMGLVMRVSDKIVALNFGRKIAEGTAEEIKTDRAVIDAYLGGVL